MTEQQVVSLGFYKVEVSADQSGSDDYYYYCIDIGTVELITTESDRADNEWCVYIFDYPDIEISSHDDAHDLINILKRNLRE